jgi:hypothetical protein
MAATLTELTDCLAATLNYPLPTARLISRLGREQEILTHGGRGRSVPKATSVDAANLLIALMVCPTPARAPEFMRDFGSLQLGAPMMTFGKKAGTAVRKRFQEGMTFRDAIGAALDLLGSPDFAADFQLEEWVGKERPGDDPKIAPVIDVTIIDTFVEAEISIDDSHFHFVQPWLLTAHSIIGAGEEGQEVSTQAARDNLLEASTATQRYQSPIRSTRTVEVGPLLPVAELLHGHSFVSLLNERFDREVAS